MKEVIDYYSSFDEWGRLDREPLEFQINWHYIQTYLPPAGEVLDNGAGPGKYSMKLAKQGYQVTLSDVTPKLVEQAKQKAYELGLIQQFKQFLPLNAMCLEGIPDEVYDASLMMGPLYHLQKEEERNAAIRELFRVTKKGGIVFVAFQSRIRMTLASLQHPQHWKPHHSLQAIQEFGRTGVFNHEEKGRFTGAYYFEIEDIKPFMEQQGFETLDLIGSSSIGGLLTNEQKRYWEEQGAYQEIIEMLIQKANDPSILGISSHLLYIGRRI